MDLIFPTSVTVRPKVLAFTDSAGARRYEARLDWAGESIGFSASSLAELREPVAGLLDLIDAQTVLEPTLPFGEGRPSKPARLPVPVAARGTTVEGFDSPNLAGDA